jgi:hypothetical protein
MIDNYYSGHSVEDHLRRFTCRKTSLPGIKKSFNITLLKSPFALEEINSIP